MIFTNTPIAGAQLIRLKRTADFRGSFARGWCAEEFHARGLSSTAAQLNVGQSHRRGTLRGMHFQSAPHAEAKSVRCTRGAIFDVVVDLRPGSPTFRKWYGCELSAADDAMLYVPPGCAHGYQTLVDDTEIYYIASTPYVATAASGVRHNDPAFGIIWPLPIVAISPADATWPDFSVQPAAASAPTSSLL